MAIETLAKLKKKLQAIINKWVRIKYSDEQGIVQCYTCSWRGHYKDADAGHCFGGAKNYNRYDPRNIRPQCYSCNRMKSGNGALFAFKLGRELGEDVIEDLATYRDVQYASYQLKALIQEWNKKLKSLAKQKGVKL